MKVHIVTITDEYGGSLVSKAFSTQEKADRWIEEYVKENWSEHFEDECPTDLDEAVNEYFFGGIVEDENLISDELIVDDETQSDEYNHVDAAVEDLSHTYDELNDGTLHQLIRERLTTNPIPLTGEHCEDYKRIRRHVERLTEEWITDRRFLS